MYSYSYVLAQSFDFPSHAVVLDVGCGIGTELVQASGSDRFVIGVEPHLAYAKQAHDRGFPVVRATAEHLPFPADSFDGIICKGVLAFTLEDQAMREIRRVVKRERKCYLAFNGSGYYLRYFLFGSWKQRIYGLRALVNTWFWVITHRRLPGFVGDTVYQSERRLQRYFKSNEFHVISQRRTTFWGFPVFIYTEVLS
jgi:SAM-dependent methyltransferase